MHCLHWGKIPASHSIGVLRHRLGLGHELDQVLTLVMRVEALGYGDRGEGLDLDGEEPAPEPLVPGLRRAVHAPAVTSMGIAHQRLSYWTQPCSYRSGRQTMLPSP